MSKVLFINSVCGYGSTGKICTDLYKMAEKRGHECCIAYGRRTAPEGYNTIKIGNKISIFFHGVKSLFLDQHAFGSKNQTIEFLKLVDEFNPDVIHLHNIHGYYINIEELFKYIKSRHRIKVIWTLHDCWSFTGHCAHFSSSQCDQWKTGCKVCNNKNLYPKCIGVSNSSENYNRKKASILGVNSLDICTPSKWLNDLAKQSYLSQYPIHTIHNGIDLSQFYPDGENKIGDDRKIILGVSNVWTEKKGYYDFIKLAQMIDNEKYKIVMVGLSQKQLKQIPENIYGIVRTSNIHELRQLYSAAYVLFNPTKEDNYPTVNIEAQACGTPVATYDVGGCSETLYSTKSITVSSLDDFISKLSNNYFAGDEISTIKYLDKNYYYNQYIDMYER